MKTFMLAGVIFVLTAAVSAQTSKDDAAIKSVIDRMTAAQLAYDSKTLDAIVTDDYIEISPLGEFDPRAKMLSFYSPEAKAKAGSLSGTIEATEHSIRNYGKFAVAIVLLTYHMTNNDKPLPERSIRATYVLKKDGVVWKVASAHYTGIRRPLAPAIKTTS